MSEDTMTPGSRPVAGEAGQAGRTARGRFAPGASGNPAGRAPKAQERAIAEASARGCPPERWEKIVAKLADLADSGDVSAARLLAQIRGAIGRDEPTTVDAAVEALDVAAIHADPAKRAALETALELIFPPGGLEAKGT